MIREHIKLTGLPLALIDASATPAALHAVHVDHLATPVAMTDPTGALSWQGSRQPYGATAIGAVTATNDNRFPGQRLESQTGLHYNYFRDYDPSTGRYIQTEPIGLAGGLNTYGYVLTNPVNLIDPEGLNPAAVCVVNPGLCAGAAASAVRAGVAAAAVAAAAIEKMCRDEDDCDEVRKRCEQKCLDLFVDNPDRLPGSGHDSLGRMRRCVRECMAEDNCFDY